MMIEENHFTFQVNGTPKSTWMTQSSLAVVVVELLKCHAIMDIEVGRCTCVLSKTYFKLASCMKKEKE